MDFQIVTGSQVPIYRQIIDQVRRAVSSGQLSEGDQLPSVRALAEQLVINPNTVARAYTDLTREGVVESQAGKGLFVAARRQRLSQDERERRLDLALDVFVGEVLFLGFSPPEILASMQHKLEALDGAAVSAAQLAEKESL